MPTLNAAFNLQDRYSRVVNSIMKTTRNAEAAMMGASAKADNLGQSFDKMSNKASSGASGIKKLLGALGGFMAVKKATDITDEYTNTVARLSLINDGLQTQKELQDSIYLSAQRSRGEYMTTAQTVAKLGMMAKDAFGSTDEIVKFTELVNKSFKVGGASKTEQIAGMYQLAQAMASGRLQGDEFRSISENAPMIGKALQQHLGVGAAKLKEMSSEGLITADVIKGAMFGMGEEINTMFEKIPKTWADIRTRIKNHAIKAFEVVMEKLNEINNSDFMSTLVNVVTTGIDILAVAFLGLANIVQFITGIISQNWDLISSIIIAAAILYLPMLIARMWDLFTTIAAQAIVWAIFHWQVVLIFAAIALLIYILMKLGVTAGDIVGFIAGGFMWLLSVLWAIFHWQVVLIFAAIALLIYILMKLGVTAGDIVGFIAGGFMWLLSVLGNIVILIINGVIWAAESIVNIFNACVTGVQNAFMSMGVAILNIISEVAKKIEWLVNLIPGVEVTISAGLDNMASNLQSKIEANVAKEVEFDRLDYLDAGAAFDKGNTWGNNLVSGIGDLFSGMTPSASGGGFGSMGDLGDYMSNGALPVTNGNGSGGSLNVSIDKEDLKYLKDIAERDYRAMGDLGDYMSNGALPVTNGNGSGGSLNVSIDKEDLKYLKDIAERDYRAEYTQATLAPNIQITFGDVKETADVNQIEKVLDKIIKEQIAVVSEG